VGSAKLKLNGTQISALRSHRGQIDLSIRPEHIKLESAGITAIVRDVQPVGPSTIVRIAWKGGGAVVRLNGIVRLAVGSPVNAVFDTDHLLFFDRTTGKRIHV
jgi:ABC-type sugar transport system ATPase subunit